MGWSDRAAKLTGAIGAHLGDDARFIPATGPVVENLKVIVSAPDALMGLDGVRTAIPDAVIEVGARALAGPPKKGDRIEVGRIVNGALVVDASYKCTERGLLKEGDRLFYSVDVSIEA